MSRQGERQAVHLRRRRWQPWQASETATCRACQQATAVDVSGICRGCRIKLGRADAWAMGGTLLECRRYLKGSTE